MRSYGYFGNVMGLKKPHPPIPSPKWRRGGFMSSLSLRNNQEASSPGPFSEMEKGRFHVFAVAQEQSRSLIPRPLLRNGEGEVSCLRCRSGMIKKPNPRPLLRNGEGDYKICIFYGLNWLGYRLGSF